MTKTTKSLLVLFAVMGLLAGCGSNAKKDDADADTSAQTTSAEDEAATAAAAEAARLEEEAREKAERLANVAKTFYFEFDQSILTAEARAALLIHAEILNDSPRDIRLEGHADERGSREYNIALGERRANAVRDFLVLQGVDASSIETVSYGEESPANSGSYESAWSANRRVELK